MDKQHKKILEQDIEIKYRMKDTIPLIISNPREQQVIQST